MTPPTEQGNWIMLSYFLPDPNSGTSLNAELLKALAEEFGENTPSLDECRDRIKAVMLSLVPTLHEEVTKFAQHEVPNERKRIREFNQHNFKRWQDGFKIAHTMLLISQDIGAFVLQDQQNTSNKHPHKLHAIIGLHAKSLRIGREVLCLMECGFADGALGHWRGLHEAATVASFLSRNDDAVSERYLIAREVQNYKAAVVYTKHQARANLMPFGDNELATLKTRNDEILSEYGPELKEEWGWAAPALNKKKATFADVEEACGLDHWRPRYKWASEDSHGNYKPNAVHLALTEATEPLLIAGQSNSGMKDPGQMLGCSIQLATSSLLSLNSSLDVQAWIEVLGVLNVDLSNALMNVNELKP